MTKTEMIDTIRNLDNERWERAKDFEKTFGVDSKEYIMALAKWHAVNNLMRDLGISERTPFPENVVQI